MAHESMAPLRPPCRAVRQGCGDPRAPRDRGVAVLLGGVHVSVINVAVKTIVVGLILFVAIKWFFDVVEK